MRMWMTDPRHMCSKHLLGEHLELHMFAGSMAKGVSMAGYVTNGLMQPLAMEARHAALAAEMLARGMRHESPLIAALPSLIAALPAWQRDAKVDATAALAELHRRCPDCRKNCTNPKIVLARYQNIN